MGENSVPETYRFLPWGIKEERSGCENGKRLLGADKGL